MIISCFFSMFCCRFWLTSYGLLSQYEVLFQVSFIFFSVQPLCNTTKHLSRYIRSRHHSSLDFQRFHFHSKTEKYLISTTVCTTLKENRFGMDLVDYWAILLKIVQCSSTFNLFFPLLSGFYSLIRELKSGSTEKSSIRISTYCLQNIVKGPFITHHINKRDAFANQMTQLLKIKIFNKLLILIARYFGFVEQLKMKV